VTQVPVAILHACNIGAHAQQLGLLQSQVKQCYCANACLLFNPLAVAFDHFHGSCNRLLARKGCRVHSKGKGSPLFALLFQGVLMLTFNARFFIAS
jgi:hypothetical protein